ncbi:hypothetical protein LRR81_16540 [Metabacillus sp. GX 13764]|uniref:hypothetical protein n=1 Tax=Metabacillus kandeliae TaxID=2900151 RepID=UPI001E36BF66|nr:hypothetical protein [Metabacillus kandeliae]MCD7035854.1 hypothetical protein [Metabacillus kandeliae]
MEKLSIELRSILKKLVLEYESKFEPMLFTLKKDSGDFIFSEINKPLRQCVNLSDDAVGKSLQELTYVTGEDFDYIHTNFLNAWNKKNSVIYYFNPKTNMDIYLVVLLEPEMDSERSVSQINGHCAAILKEDLPYTAQELFALQENTIHENR